VTCALPEQNRISACLQQWSQCVIYPLHTVGRATSYVARQRSISPVFAIWFPSIFISVITQVPVEHLFGIEWNNGGFHAAFLLLYILQISLGSVCVHVGMLLFQLQSRLPETLSLYTINVIYSPLTNIFLIPATYHSYQTVYLFKQAHSQNVSLIDAVVQIIKAFKVNANVSPLFYIETIFWYGAGFISIIVLAAFAECLSQWYKNGRYQTYHAVTASVVVGIVVINMVCCPLNFLILYNYIEITK
jgi:hypothetical protein